MLRSVLFSTLILGVLGEALQSGALYREKKIFDILKEIYNAKSSSSNAHSQYTSYEKPQLSDVSDPESRSSVSECRQIMKAFDEGNLDAKSANKAVQSCWPYTRTKSCATQLTRDYDYDPNRDYQTKDMMAETMCGRSMFMHDTKETTLIKNLKRVLAGGDVQELDSRIVGGVKSSPAKYPWMVSIGNANHGLSCGGAIINKDWVVSASHCFTKRTESCHFNVRVGSFNWGYDTEGYHQDIAADKIFTHPDYDEENNDNDIAMVKLSKSLDLNPTGYINAMCLPESDMEDKRYDVGKSCVAAGWGTLKEDGSVSMTLEEVDLKLLSRTACEHEGMTKNQFCAGYLKGGKDTCQGDSGGPVMCQRSDGRWYHQGVTSYGNGCGRKNWPGVYTQVSHYVHWIRSVIGRFSD